MNTVGAQRARAIALVVVAALLVFGPGLVGAFVWDDHGLIVSNASLHDLRNLPRLLRSDFWAISANSETGEFLARSYWRPVVTLAYALEYKLFGLSALGYHVVNLALHVACGLLAFGFLQRRLSPADERTRDLAATVGALLFTVHPSRPESVTWISGSTDLWMALWVLLAARVLDGARPRRGLLAGALCALGLLSKEAAVVAPALFVADAWLLDRPKPHRREALTAAAVMAAALVARILVLPPRQLTGASNAAGIVPRVLSSLGHYVACVAWPWPPSAQVGYRAADAAGHAMFVGWSVALGAATVAALVALALTAWRRLTWRPALADVLWFVAPLALVLNALDLRLNVLAAMRFLYLPMVGVAALVARGITALPTARVRVGLGAAGVAIVAMTVVSIGHVGHFVTDEDLWTWEVSVNPRNPFALAELARLRREQGRSDEAIRLYAQGIAAARTIHDRYHDTQLVLKLAATLMLTTPDFDQETLVRLRDFFDAVDRGDAAPVRLDVRGMRVALRWTDDERAARRRYQYRVVRAITHARTLSLVEAEQQLREVLAATPDAWLAWQNLGLVYAAMNRWDDAVRALVEAARRAPNSAAPRALARAMMDARARVTATPDGTLTRERAVAAALVDLHAYEAARRRLDALLSSSPTDTEAVLLRARVEREQGRESLAEAVILRARAQGAQGL